MKKICIFSNHFYPVKSSCSTLIKDLIKSLLKENYSVNLITISGIKNKLRIIKKKNFSYYGYKSPYFKSDQKYLRAFGEIFSISYLRFILNNEIKNADYYFVYSPTIFWSILTPILDKKKISIILRDIYPKWLIDNNLLKKKSISYSVLKYFEMKLYKNSNRILIQTPKDFDYFKSLNKNYHIGVLYNWIDTFNKKLICHKRKNKKYIRFIYTGIIGDAQNYKILFNLISYCNLRDYKALFIIIGSGSKLSELKKLIDLNKFKNIKFINEIKLIELDKYIQKSDICLCTLNEEFKSDNFPGKILRYMLYNKPILTYAPGNAFLKNLMHSNKIGLFANDISELNQHIYKIFNDKYFFETYGKQSYEVLKQNYSVEKSIENLLSC